MALTEPPPISRWTRDHLLEVRVARETSENGACWLR